jgi:hypothetical protein
MITCGENDRDFKIDYKDVDISQSLKISLKSNDGFLIRLSEL